MWSYLVERNFCKKNSTNIKRHGSLRGMGSHIAEIQNTVKT